MGARVPRAEMPVSQVLEELREHHKLSPTCTPLHLYTLEAGWAP